MTDQHDKQHIQEMLQHLKTNSEILNTVFSNNRKNVAKQRIYTGCMSMSYIKEVLGHFKPKILNKSKV